MAVTLKRLVGNAGAGLDESHGTDNLYDVLKGLVDFQADVVTQFNQLKADHDSSTTPSTATDLAVEVTAEE